MGIEIRRNTLHSFADDYAKTPATEMREMQKAVRDTGREGLSLAKADAASKAGKVARFYPRAMTLDVSKPFLGFGGSAWSAIYGPDINRKQGVLAMERGPGRQAAPHLSLAISADVIGPRLGIRCAFVYDEVFW